MHVNYTVNVFFCNSSWILYCELLFLSNEFIFLYKATTHQGEIENVLDNVRANASIIEGFPSDLNCVNWAL